VHDLLPDEYSIIESALRDSEERHELLFHCAPGPMWVFDVETLRILAVNEAALRAYGYTRDEFLSLTLRELRSPESRAAFWRAHTSLRAGREVHGVFQHRRRDESVIDVEVRTSTLPIGGGRLRLTLATDITDQKRGFDAATFLDKASGILMASLEYDFLCRNLANLAVPALGDWCVVYRHTDAGIADCGYAHANPLLQSLVGELAAERDETSANDPIFRAWRDATVVALTGEEATQAMRRGKSPHAAEVLRILDSHSVLYVPILGRGGTIGVLECALSGERRPHDASVRALAMALAERAALAMDNAERYTEMRSAAISGHAPVERGAASDDELAGAVLEHHPSAYLRVDAQWTLQHVNAQAESTLGRPREDLVGRDFWSLFPGVRGSRFEQEYRRAVDEQRAVSFEEFYPGLDSWFEVNAQPVGGGLAIVFRDITRQRRQLERTVESEAQYRDFLDSATDLIHMLTPDGRVLFANAAWRRTLGYSEEEVGNLTLFDVLAPESYDVAKNTLESCLVGRELPEQELVVVAKDGRRVVVRGRANCRFENGVPVSTRGIYRDVTHEVETRTLLARAQRTEAATARARTAFLDRMSHEMRTPLTAVIGFADILAANRSGTLGAKEQQFAHRIGVQGRHLLSVVEDVLSYAEIESRRVELLVAPIELTSLAREVHGLYVQDAEERGVVLDMVLPPRLTYADTDPTTLRRVMRYMMSDALSRHAAERVTLEVEANANTGQPTAICVRAEAGIAEGTMPRPDATVAETLDLGITIAQSLAHVLGYELAYKNVSEGVTQRTLRLGGQPRVGSREDDESAKTLHAVLDASPLPIIAFEPDWTVRLWNKAAQELFGWTSAESIERRFALLRQEDEAGFRQLLRSALDSPQGVTDAPAVHVHRDGRPIDVRVALAALRAPDGRLRGFLSIVTDVTARKRLEEELRQAQKMEVVGRLAGGIAHDFNNLLTVISAHSQFLEGDLPKGSELVGDARAIHEASQRAAALTRQLLAFSRKDVPHRRLVDLNQTLLGTERMLRRILGSHIEFATVPSSEPVCITADPAQVEQVFMNLVLNARDAMPRGGALVVETSVTTVDQADAIRLALRGAGPYAQITVSDTGIGMDESTRARIFEPFFTTKGEHRGTGLGLSTVHAIVTEGDGAIAVESTPGAGTTFHVWFPLADAPSSPVPARELAGGLRGTETVLLVEDQDAVRAVAARVLRAYGYTVLTARHGNDALGIVRDQGSRIALLLTDLVMPEMPGNELAQRVLAEAPQVRVLFMSGYSETPAGLSAADEEMPLVRKPFGGEDLARAVRGVLDG